MFVVAQARQKDEYEYWYWIVSFRLNVSWCAQTKTYHGQRWHQSITKFSSHWKCANSCKCKEQQPSSYPQLPLLTATQPLTPAGVCPPTDRIIQQVEEDRYTTLTLTYKSDWRREARKTEDRRQGNAEDDVGISSEDYEDVCANQGWAICIPASSHQYYLDKKWA